MFGFCLDVEHLRAPASLTKHQREKNKTLQTDVVNWRGSPCSTHSICGSCGPPDLLISRGGVCSGLNDIEPHMNAGSLLTACHCSVMEKDLEAISGSESPSVD